MMRLEGCWALDGLEVREDSSESRTLPMDELGDDALEGLEVREDSSESRALLLDLCFFAL